MAGPELGIDVEAWGATNVGMPFRLLSVPMALFFVWAAAMQLNDPDPTRWFLIYASVAALAGLNAAGRPAPRLALVLSWVALAWAAAIVPELWARWSVRDLGAQMSASRPEVEFGREFVGLLILAAYCAAAAYLTRRPTDVSRPAVERASQDER